MNDLNCTWEHNEDGTYAVRSVPIFALGEHRGFQYDEAWARRALKTFSRLKKEHGYLPPVILGHTTDSPVEKPAVGFVDRLRLIGRRIVADLVGLSREVFEDIRAGRWPYRSVEVFDRAAQITALALLGGTPPYLKTAPLHFTDDGRAAVWVEGNDLPRLGSGQEQLEGLPGGAMQETDRKRVKKFSEDEVERLVEAARADERTKAGETLDQTKQRLAELEHQAHEAQVRMFRSELRGLGYSPAIVESPEMNALAEELSRRSEPVKFGEETVQAVALLGRLLSLIAERVAGGCAFVETGERAHAGRFHQFGAGNGGEDEDAAASQFGDRVDPASVRRLVRARDLAKAEGITFRDALARVAGGDVA